MIRIILAATAAIALVPAAWAAQPPLADEVLSICGANLYQLDRAAATAQSRGYKELTIPLPEGMKTARAFIKDTGGARWVVVLGTNDSPAAGDVPAQALGTCSISGADPGLSGSDVVRRWIGMPDTAMGDRNTEQFFVQRGGRRTLITPDAATTTKALNEGGYALLQVVRNEGSVGIALTTARKAN